jgi:hypothetical protein
VERPRIFPSQHGYRLRAESLRLRPESTGGRTGVVQLEFEPERVRFLDAPEIKEVHVP